MRDAGNCRTEHGKTDFVLVMNGCIYDAQEKPCKNSKFTDKKPRQN